MNVSLQLPSSGNGDELRTPLSLLPQLLEQHFDGRDPSPIFTAVAGHFEAKYAAHPERMQQVPVLTAANAETLPAGGLVRFRGMVVDMFNPEFFLGAYRWGRGGWRPGALYTDTIPPDVEAAAATRIFERRPLLLTPVPHEQPWATAVWAGRPVEPPTPTPFISERAAPKRGREIGGCAGSQDSAACGIKAARVAGIQEPPDAAPSAGGGGGSDQGTAAAAAGGGAPAAAGAALVPQDAAGGGGGGGDAAPPSFQPGDCIVQLYGEREGLSLHDVVEVLGVLSVVPALAALNNAGAGDDGMMDVDGGDADAGWGGGHGAALPPTSQVLRLHALCAHKLPPHPCSGPRRSPSPAPSAPLAVLRSRALALLAAPLAGDELAAEYVLLAALGAVVNREEGNGAVGHLPLNLTCCPDASSAAGSSASQLVPGLAAALRCLLPHVAMLPLSVPALNDGRWHPAQHAASGRLQRGCLQLAQGTLLLLDETGMAAGELREPGIRSLQALSSVLREQVLPCTCQVYDTRLSVDVPAIVMSTGRSVLRDVLPLVLPLAPQAPVLSKPGHGTPTGGALVAWPDAAVAGPGAVAAAAAGMPELGAVRDYLAAARRAQCRLDRGAVEAAVARFRAAGGGAEPGSALQELGISITLSKLLASSLGQGYFTLELWERAMGLEAARKQRIAAAAAAASAASAATAEPAAAAPLSV